MKVTKSFALAVMAGVVSNGQAAPLDEMVVTSSRIPISLRQTGTSVSILTAEDIQAHGNASLTTILRQMPGISSNSNGSAGSTTSLRVRGEEAFRTLTIIDGIRIADPSGPQVATQMEHLMSSGVSRVEILRGPQGLAYGADAGGVINISSPILNQGVGFDAEAQTGEFGTQQYSASFIGSNEQGDIYIQGVDFSTDGFNSLVADTVLQDKDGYENQTWHTRLGWNMSQDIRLELVHRNVDGKNEYDGCFDPSTFITIHDCVGEYALSASRIALEYTSDLLSHSLSYASSTTDRENFAAGASSFIAKGELKRWEYMSTLESLPGTRLVFGADHEQASTNGNSRDNIGAYFEYLSDFSETLFVTAGVRYDDNDDFGTHTSYRFTGAYLYELENEATLKFKASVGTGFRAPSPYEVAFNQGPYAYPPASLLTLQEETSKGYEAGLEYFKDSLHLQAVYFNQEVDNAIIFDLTGFSGYLQDAGKSKSKGLELSGEFNLSQSVAFNVNYTFNATKAVDGQQGIRRPKQLANVGLGYSSLDQRLNLNAFYRLSRDTEDELFGNRVVLDDFGILGFTASYGLGKNVVIFARLENITDEDYQEVAGFNTAGRAAYLGLRVSYDK